MYSDRTLVGIGCSHTFGEFLCDVTVDIEPTEIAHNRSWVKKLERLAGFKNSVNLAVSGGSNKRSIRTIMEYVLNDPDQAKNLVVMIGITELFRTEFPSIEVGLIDNDLTSLPEFERRGYFLNKLGPWSIDQLPNELLNNFVKIYYGHFTVDDYSIQMANYDFLNLHLFLNHYQIEHYFPIMLGKSNNFLDVIGGVKMPYIKFYDSGTPTDALNHAKSMGHKVGKDYDEKSNCNHLDDAGNEFLAHYILNAIKEIQHGI